MNVVSTGVVELHACMITKPFFCAREGVWERLLWNPLDAETNSYHASAGSWLRILLWVEFFLSNGPIFERAKGWFFSATAKFQSAWIGTHREIVGDDIFFPTVVYLEKHSRQTNGGLFSNSQGKQHCRTFHLRRRAGDVYRASEILRSWRYLVLNVGQTLASLNYSSL